MLYFYHNLNKTGSDQFQGMHREAIFCLKDEKMCEICLKRQRLIISLKEESFEKSSITSEDSDMLIQNKDDFKALFGN